MTLCVCINVISVLKLDVADSSEVLLPVYQITQCLSQNMIILIQLRLLQPRICAGGLFGQEMNIRKIIRFCVCCLVPFLSEIFKLFA